MDSTPKDKAATDWGLEGFRRADEAYAEEPYPQTFEPENKIPPRRCSQHDYELEWIEDGGRQVMRCRQCWEGQKVQHSEFTNNMPLIKFAQNFHRGRPLTQKEKRHPPRKPQ